MKKALHSLYVKTVHFLMRIQFNLVNYARFNYPNKRKIKNGTLKFKTKPICAQKIKVYGEGVLDIGTNCHFGYKLGGHIKKGYIDIQTRDKNAKVTIGDYVSTNNNLLICAIKSVEIGSNSLIGLNVSILDHEAHGIEPDKRNELGANGEVKIGDNVWIGNNVTILKGSQIGKNTVVATGAVVSGQFPENVIIGGIPAKIIKSL